MLLKQVELKKAEIKALVSMDKSLRLVFDINLTPSNEADINAVHSLLYKPLTLEIKEDGTHRNQNGQTTNVQDSERATGEDQRLF